MATNSNWTVVFDDKMIINQTLKNNEGHSIGYFFKDSSYDFFWNDPKWFNVWAIQYKDDDLDYNDTVEFRDNTPHQTWNQANLGDFALQFITKWDSAHLTQLQSNWDNATIIEYNQDGTIISTESTEDKIARLGVRPTSYSSI